MAVAREEFQRLTVTIDNGFQGINTRLDRLNDRTHKVENSDTELRTRITANDGRLTAIEETLFDQQRERRQAPDDRSATKRESAIVILGLAVMTVLVKLAFLFGSAVIDMLKTALKLK